MFIVDYDSLTHFLEQRPAGTAIHLLTTSTMHADGTGVIRTKRNMLDLTYRSQLSIDPNAIHRFHWEMSAQYGPDMTPWGDAGKAPYTAMDAFDDMARLVARWLEDWSGAVDIVLMGSGYSIPEDYKPVKGDLSPISWNGEGNVWYIADQ